MLISKTLIKSVILSAYAWISCRGILGNYMLNVIQFFIQSLQIICLGPIGPISMQFQIVGLEYHTGESSVPPDYFNNNNTSKTQYMYITYICLSTQAQQKNYTFHKLLQNKNNLRIRILYFKSYLASLITSVITFKVFNLHC